MVEISVTEDEKRQGRLAPGRHQEAVEAIRRDGLVVLADLIDLGHIEVLRERMVEDSQKLLQRKDRPFNWNPGNLQQNPPPEAPFLFRDVLVNDVVISVTQAILGRGLKNGFYSGNTALPSDQRQPVHADIGQLWPDLIVAHPAYGLVVNVPLVDMDERNGSTEVWPGTHTDTTVAFQDGEITIPAEVLERQRAVQPPLQPKVRAGSFLVRDIRMWHAGMPNRTEQPRPMMAMIHSVSWWPTSALKFPKGTEGVFEHPDLNWHIDFTEGPIDHISEPQAYAYREVRS
ncbi:MAG TPA: phytanoyl-CoA dioxygenase family protein [Fimbriimonas sp.]